MRRLASFLLLLPLSGAAQTRLNIASLRTNGTPSVAVPIIQAPLLHAPQLPSVTALTPSISPTAVSPVAAPALAAAAAVPAPSAPNAERPAEAQASAESARFDGSSAASPREDSPLSVLIAGAEAVPFIKTGGLADVVDAVSAGLAGRGHRVTMVLPKYRQLKLDGFALTPAGHVSVPIGGRTETARLLVGERSGVKVVLLEHPGYYEREGGIYSSYSGYDAEGHDDADERFGFFARGALEAAKALGIKPDVVHAHDWHAALMPVFLKESYAADPFFAAAKSVVTIHNIAFQGVFGARTAVKLGLNPEGYGKSREGEYNFLRAGLAAADAVTTVSPTYAREIVERPDFGMGMETLLASRPGGVSGIINGVDPELWDPRTDATLARNYGVEDAAEGKAANKAAMQARLGLEPAPGKPLFAVASRLAHQKGIDMVLEAARGIVAMGGQLAIMGSGDKPLEEAVARLVKEFPGSVASHGFDEVAVRMIFAAADFLLMPSRFEPCGLSQLIAQRYGTIPLVTRTGGLVDTVRDLREDPVNGDGLFIRAQASISLLRAVADAVSGHAHGEALAYARRAAMTKDSSWEIPLDLYEALYRRLLRADGPGKA